ncbi:hypothetical protein PHYBOEH_006295 [Phytophthora boehmeriae]|uniref:Complex 1 LYR protein domain-containing protein n=1 Tax=Phytophthora boehmeriae TaxID=109152 RepID=A0A8T1WJZ6_9STRA|nr:hypothetical protein PHYBOEH_006295 [Phytophthora boehmeriae]
MTDPQLDELIEEIIPANHIAGKSIWIFRATVFRQSQTKMTGIGARREVLALYRAVLRVARDFPDRPMARKLQFNARELIQLRRGERSDTRVQQHLTDGWDALQVYQELQKDQNLLTAITRKKRMH